MPTLTVSKSLTRSGASANVIRNLIRTEAPGTLYVDGHNRENYLRPATLTESMKDYLETFDARIKKEAVPKLKEVMGGARWIEHG
jgi:predicted PP-loop superfamily ATPase